jgi:DUF4097 and DUF4098 domain-containing protein YvlB
LIESDFSVGDSAMMRIAIRSGRIDVEAGEAGAVQVTVDTRDRTFEVRQRGDTIVASGKRGDRAHVTVRVPPTTDIDASSTSGDVNVSSPVRHLDVVSASGNVLFGSVERLQTRSSSGSIRGDSVAGEARCETASGDIRISQILERGDLATASGNIAVDLCAGTISCSTVSGNVRLNVVTGPSLTIKSTSGLVRVGIPSGTRLDLDANTFSGRVTLPSPNPHPEPAEREITARVRLVSGDLRIDRVD